ncbi:response regulator [Flavobacterium faecale]|nr:response regulator [Flavobacterium faecale]
MLFLFYLKLDYAAWATIPIILLFIQFSFSKNFTFPQKSVLAVTAITLFYSYSYILYGKSLNYVILAYWTAIILLIVIRYIKLMYLFLGVIIVFVLVTNYYDFFGFDYGNKQNFESDIYNPLFYFMVIMISLYLIILLVARTTAVTLIINDLKSKNNELNESRAELKKLQINKESFFAIMSHEIRTPLNAIKGISDILKSNIQSEEDQNLLELMDYSTNHLLALVNNILDFTKLNDGVFTLQYSEFNIQKSLHSLFKMNERLAIEKGLVFKIETTDNLPNFVYGDKNRINQIVLNLLNNAIEYTKKGSVTMKIGGEYAANNKNEYLLQVIIEDTGKGIDKTLAEKLFQKYATSNASKNSVGLGLTISKGLIDLMKGKISFESEVKVGTTFYLTFPLPVVLKKEKDVEDVEKDFENTNLKMLLVDDNKINLLVLQKQIVNKLKKCELTIAYNGLEALNLIKENQYDIILMDVIMPVMDGIEATTHIRALTDSVKNKIPIIALTANVGEKELNACLNAGMNDFVTKPFEINALLKIMSRELQSTNVI